MKILKAKFKDEAGFYNMTWYYNPHLWHPSNLLAHECQKSNSVLIQIFNS